MDQQQPPPPSGHSQASGERSRQLTPTSELEHNSFMDELEKLPPLVNQGQPSVQGGVPLTNESWNGYTERMEKQGNQQQATVQPQGQQQLGAESHIQHVFPYQLIANDPYARFRQEYQAPSLSPSSGAPMPSLCNDYQLNQMNCHYPAMSAQNDFQPQMDQIENPVNTPAGPMQNYIHQINYQNQPNLNQYQSMPAQNQEMPPLNFYHQTNQPNQPNQQHQNVYSPQIQPNQGIPPQSGQYQQPNPPQHSRSPSPQLLDNQPAGSSQQWMPLSPQQAPQQPNSPNQLQANSPEFEVLYDGMEAARAEKATRAMRREKEWIRHRHAATRERRMHKEMIETFQRQKQVESERDTIKHQMESMIVTVGSAVIENLELLKGIIKGNYVPGQGPSGNSHNPPPPRRTRPFNNEDLMRILRQYDPNNTRDNRGTSRIISGAHHVRQASRNKGQPSEEELTCRYDPAMGGWHVTSKPRSPTAGTQVQGTQGGEVHMSPPNSVYNSDVANILLNGLRLNSNSPSSSGTNSPLAQYENPMSHLDIEGAFDGNIIPEPTDPMMSAVFNSVMGDPLQMDAANGNGMDAINGGEQQLMGGSGNNNQQPDMNNGDFQAANQEMTGTYQRKQKQTRGRRPKPMTTQRKWKLFSGKDEEANQNMEQEHLMENMEVASEVVIDGTTDAPGPSGASAANSRNDTSNRDVELQALLNASVVYTSIKSRRSRKLKSK